MSVFVGMCQKGGWQMGKHTIYDLRKNEKLNY